MLDQSTNLERLRLECVDIRSQVDQSTAAEMPCIPCDSVLATSIEKHGGPNDDDNATASEVGSTCDDDAVTNAHLIDTDSQCLVDVNTVASTKADSQHG